jgi:uncharacterized protein YfiM (DUF2279 family)
MRDPDPTPAATAAEPRSKSVPGWAVRLALLLAWFLAISWLPDPRPLSAPDWSVRATQALLGLSEPAARAVSTMVLRGIGFALIGILVALLSGRWRLRWAAPAVLLASPLLAVASQWINFGYFPLRGQVQLSVATAIMGALLGLALRRRALALGALVAFATAVFVWGSSTNVCDDLDAAARFTGDHVLASAEDAPAGDAGFDTLLRAAFAFAEDNSHGTDAVFPSRAAVLALSVILGEERVAEVARRPIDLGRVEEIRRLRDRITLRGRKDLAQHFWVSAGLAIVTDEHRALTIGIGKELMDSTSGGSGFSFVDMMANRAGIMFAAAATENATAARGMQFRIGQGMGGNDLLPDFQGLPEGIPDARFRTEFGGLRGEGSRRVDDEITRRLATARGLQWTSDVPD